MSLIVHAYDYVSLEGGECFNMPGSVVMQHLRMEPKSFRYRWPDATKPSGWTWQKPPWADYMLYGLERLSAAVTTKDESLSWVVYWTEGEKDADNINALGLPRVVAVSHHGGALKATPAQAAYLEGWLGRVVVCADVDEAGAACALARYDLLRRIGIRSASLSVVRPADPMTKGRDITDHLSERHGLYDLVDVPIRPLRARVGRMTPAQKRNGSGWRTGDPEVDAFDLSTWRPTVRIKGAGR